MPARSENVLTHATSPQEVLRSLRWPDSSPGVFASLTLAIFACGDGAEFSPAAAPDAVRAPQSARVPVITAVSPPLASSLGGSSLTIAGRSFTSTQMTLTTAYQALPAGPVEVKVVNPDGRQGVRSDVLTLFNDNLNLVALRASQAINGAALVGTPDVNGDGKTEVSRYSSTMAPPTSIPPGATPLVRVPPRWPRVS